MARTYNPTLDGIRGLAILGVLLTHATSIFEQRGISLHLTRSMTAGWSGVDLFFVLSGFLITGILIDSRAASNRANAFYMRRVLRIFPIYYLTLALLFIAASLAPKLVMFTGIRSWTERLAYIFYLQNWLTLRNPHYSFALPLGHFWSLAVEEQFYLVWPWIIWRVSPRTVVKLCIAGACAALLLRIWLVAHFGPHLWIHMQTPTRGEGLLVGSALAAVAASKDRVPKRWLIAMTCAGVAILAFILIGDPLEFTNTDSGPYIYTIGVSGLALVFGGLVGSSAYSVPILTRLLNQNWLKQLGKYSYGIYVYHLPIYVAANSGLKRLGVRFPLPLLYSLLVTVLEIAFTCGVAWVSYTAFESRFLRLKRSFEPDVRTRVPFPDIPHTAGPAPEMAGEHSS